MQSPNIQDLLKRRNTLFDAALEKGQVRIMRLKTFRLLLTDIHTRIRIFLTYSLIIKMMVCFVIMCVNNPLIGQTNC